MDTVAFHQEREGGMKGRYPEGGRHEKPPPLHDVRQRKSQGRLPAKPCTRALLRTHLP